MNEGIHESDEVEEERKEREREDQVGYTSIFAHDPVSRQGIHGAAWEEPTAELTYLASCRIGRSGLPKARVSATCDRGIQHGLGASSV